MLKENVSILFPGNSDVLMQKEQSRTVRKAQLGRSLYEQDIYKRFHNL